MKSQESSFSDIQLQDPAGRRNSNPGLYFQLVTFADFVFAYCDVGVNFRFLRDERSKRRSIEPAGINLSS